MQRSFLRHLIYNAWMFFFRVSKQGPCFTTVEKDGGDKRLVLYTFMYKTTRAEVLQCYRTDLYSHLLFTVVEHTLGCCDAKGSSSGLLLTRVQTLGCCNAVD